MFDFRNTLLLPSFAFRGGNNPIGGRIVQSDQRKAKWQRAPLPFNEQRRLTTSLRVQKWRFRRSGGYYSLSPCNCSLQCAMISRALCTLHLHFATFSGVGNRLL